MQPVKFDEIISRVAQKKSISPEVLKSIGLHIFGETKKEMSLFGNISLIIPGLIIIFYGKSRMEKLLEKVDKKLQGDTSVQVSFLQNKDEEFLGGIKEKIKHLLAIYEVYIKDKKITKEAYKQAQKLKS